MPSIGDHLNSLLPNGSIVGGNKSIDQCPNWPPDLFAVGASLLDRSSLYSDLCFTAGWDERRYLFSDEYVNEVGEIAREWAKAGTTPNALNDLWYRLLESRDADINDPGDWHRVAIRLMTIADQASVGVGFKPNEGSKELFPLIVMESHIAEISKKAAKALPYIPTSLCICVPKQVACVQPKTMVPSAGCTLRSLSHNLALLPSAGVVSTSWLYMSPTEDEDKPLNLLVVPYPYVINGNHFVASKSAHDSEEEGYFSFNSGWRNRDGELVTSVQIADVICELVKVAQRETPEVHGIILPETALTEEQATEVAKLLGEKNKCLELFISGIETPETKEKPSRNSAFTARLHQGALLDSWKQSKHHRWGLDRGQIVRYHLGSVLDPSKKWWEKVDVSNRTCVFSVVRGGASLAVLVCEDLARFDPVMPVVLAVGPNLVITLLMDGPQFEWRWPARYATVLADDPGSSVLTVTSLGMVRRSAMPGEKEHREIALWKQDGDSAKELRLPPGDHALLLSLTMACEEQITMDRRKDGGNTQRFRLGAARGIRFDPGKSPDWMQLD